MMITDYGMTDVSATWALLSAVPAMAREPKLVRDYPNDAAVYRRGNRPPHNERFAIVKNRIAEKKACAVYRRAPPRKRNNRGKNSPRCFAEACLAPVQNIDGKRLSALLKDEYAFSPQGFMLAVVFVRRGRTLAAQTITTADAFFSFVSDNYAKITEYSRRSPLPRIQLETETMTGRLFSRNEPSAYRFSNPDQQTIVFNGEVLTIYLPSYNVVLNQSVDKGSGASGLRSDAPGPVAHEAVLFHRE
jgi:hypothetical protein